MRAIFHFSNKDATNECVMFPRTFLRNAHNTNNNLRGKNLSWSSPRTPMRPRRIQTGTQRPNYVNIFSESLRFSGRTGAQLVSAARPSFEGLWSYKNECFFIFFFDDLKAVTLTVCAVCQKFCVFSFYSFFSIGKCIFFRCGWCYISRWLFIHIHSIICIKHRNFKAVHSYKGFQTVIIIKRTCEIIFRHLTSNWYHKKYFNKKKADIFRPGHHLHQTTSHFRIAKNSELFHFHFRFPLETQGCTRELQP